MNVRLPIVIIALALLPSAALAGKGPSADNAETRFVVYYGNDFSETTMDALSESDVLVVHPGVDGLTPAVVAELQNNGVSQVLCYLSVGEDARRNPVHMGDGTGPTTHNGEEPIAEYAGVASFYVDMEYNREEFRYERDFEADTNSTYGSRYVFPNADWRHVLEHQRLGGSKEYPARNDAGVAQMLGARSTDLDENRANNFGCDGLFLDTVATSAPFLSKGRYAWAAEEMSYAIEQMRRNYPAAYLMANGVGYFFNPAAYSPDFDVRPYEFTIRPFIDAIAWESYRISAETGEESPYYFSHAHGYAPKIVAESMRPDGFAVFTIEYAQYASESVVLDTIDAVSAENGWTSYFAEDTLLRGVGRHIGDLSLPVDASPPVWDSTGSGSSADRVGVQRLEPGDSYGELVVAWDVAKDQTGPITFDVEVSQSADMSTALLFENVVTRVGRGWAQDPSSSFAYETSIEGLPEGDYYVRVRARDGLGQVERNEVVLSIRLGLQRVSNGAEGIVVDGELDDWLDLEPLGADPDDLVAALDDSDATMLWMGDEGGDLYVAVDVEGVYDRGGRNLIFIDADRDATTGYGRDLAFGADYLVREQQVYAYQGTGESWAWGIEGTAVLGAGTDGEMSFPLRWIGNPSEFEVVFQGLTEPAEYAPDTGDALGGERYLYVVSDPQTLGPASFSVAPQPQPPPPPPVGPARFSAPVDPPEPACKQRVAALRGPQACRVRR